MTIKVQLKREVNGVMQQVNPITSEDCVVLSDGKKLNEVMDFATTAEDFVDETIVIEENLVDRVESMENKIETEFEQQNSQIATGLSNIKTIEQNISNKVDTEVAKVNAQLSDTKKELSNKIQEVASTGTTTEAVQNKVQEMAEQGLIQAYTLGDGTVEPQKTTFITRDSVNLFDRNSSDNIKNALISDTGEIKTSPSWSYFVSHKILVDKTYRIKGFLEAPINIAEFTSDDAFIKVTKNIQTTSDTLELSDNVGYIRFQQWVADVDKINESTNTLINGDSIDEYVPYGNYKLDKSLVEEYITEVKEYTDDKVEELNLDKFSNLEFTQNVNLYDKNKCTVGALRGEDGTVNESLAEWMLTTDFIDITENKELTLYPNKESGHYGAIYDADKGFIKSFALSSNKLDTYRFTEGAYVRFSITRTIENEKSIVYGTTQLPYVEHKEVLCDETMAVKGNEIVIQEVIHVAKDVDCNIFHDNIIVAPDGRRTVYFDAYGKAGDDYKRFYKYKPTTSKDDVKITIISIDDYMNVNSQKEVTIRTIDTTSVTSQSLNILCFGDSFTDMGGYIYSLDENLRNVNITPTFIGTKTSKKGFKYEGWSGGRIEQFVSSESPFWNSTTSRIDFKKYLDDNALPNPDYIVMQFALNDVGLFKKQNYDYEVGNVLTLFNEFKRVCPNVKLIYSIEPCGAVNYETQNTITRKVSILEFYKQLMEQFKHTMDFYFAPSYAWVDRINGYSNKKITIDRLEVQEDTTHDAIHCNDGGMYQIGDCVFSVMMAVMLDRY